MRAMSVCGKGGLKETERKDPHTERHLKMSSFAEGKALEIEHHRFILSFLVCTRFSSGSSLVPAGRGGIVSLEVVW